jgi:endonuclease/exonuclease/phosphatase family metal-dependent hydrolase
VKSRSGVVLEIACALLAFVCFASGWQLARPVDRSFRPTTRSAETLRVVTWNIGGGLSGDMHAARDEELDHVLAVLRTLDPDVVFLQELAKGSQLEALRSGLGADWRAVRTAAGGRVVAVFARGGRLVTETEGRRTQRWTAIRWRRDEHELLAVGMHAHAHSSRRRNAEIGSAHEALLAIPGGAARIFAGDLNIDLDLGKRGDLFTDDRYRDVETYNFVAQDLVDAGRGTGSTAEPDRRLDYVFFKEEGLELRSAGPWRGQRIGDMDHDPVAVDFRWR